MSTGRFELRKLVSKRSRTFSFPVERLIALIQQRIPCVCICFSTSSNLLAGYLKVCKSLAMHAFVPYWENGFHLKSFRERKIAVETARQRPCHLPNWNACNSFFSFISWVTTPSQTRPQTPHSQLWNGERSLGRKQQYIYFFPFVLVFFPPFEWWSARHNMLPH